MSPTTLAYVVLLLLLGIHYQNVYVLSSAFLYFIVMLILEPYVKEGALELISILTITLLWMILIRIDVKGMEHFIETVQTRPCQIYFTDETMECDRGDFLLSDLEFDEKYPVSQIPQSQGLLVHYKFENTLTNEVNANANRLTSVGNMSYVDGRNGGKALYLMNEANVTAGSAAANYVVNPTFIFPNIFTISMHLKFTRFSTIQQYVPFVTNSGPNILTRSLVIYVYQNVLYCTFENIPGAAVGSYPIVVGVWYDIMITYNNNTMVLYVNGVNTGSKTYTQGFTQNGFMLGNDSTTARFPFAGMIDDFRIYDRILPISVIPTNIAIRGERLRLQAVCKQEFPGWIEAANQPIKQPKDLVSRGNLRDWAFCYKPLFDPNSTALYDKSVVEAKFNAIKTQFNSKHASYGLVDLDKDYVPIPANINLRYNQAIPEYIRMYFKSPIAMETFVGGAAPIAIRPPPVYASSDVSATCDNDAVSYTTRFANLPPQYGLEVRFIQNTLTSAYSIAGIKCIRTASITNANQFMYEPDVTKVLSSVFDIKTNIADNTVYLQGKASINVTLYKFVKDICGRLSYSDMKKDSSFNLSSYLSSAIQTYLYNGAFYRFNLLEPITNSTIAAYDETRIATQTTALQNIPNDTSPVSSRNGFIHKVFMLSHDFDNYKVLNVTNMNTIRNVVSGISIEDQLKYKLLEHRIYKATTDIKQGLITSELPIHYKKYFPYSIYQSFEGYLDMSPVIQNQPYQFRLFIDSYDRDKLKALYNTTEDKRPLRYYMDLTINGTVVTQFYYCPGVDNCINTYNTTFCLARQKEDCKIPEWTDYFVGAGRTINDAHHPIGSAILNAANNTIQVRIFTNANLTDPTPFCRIAYKAPNQNTFRIIENSRIYYSKRDYANYIVAMNTRLVQTVSENKRQVTEKMMEYIARNYNATAMPIDKNYISTNNRAYIFFQPPTAVAATDILPPMTETVNVRAFIDTAFSPN